MPIASTTEFDRKRDFKVYFDNEPVGAARWIAAVMRQS